MEGLVVLFFLAFVAVVLGMVVHWALGLYSRRLVGPIRMRVDRRRPRMGEEVSFRASITPTGTLNVNRLTVRAHGYEWIQWRERRSTTDSKGRSTTRTVTRTSTHTLFERTFDKPVRGAVAAGRKVEVRGSFTVPSEGPPSFSAPDNKLVWAITVEVDIAGLPDVSESYPIQVQPVRLEGSA